MNKSLITAAVATYFGYLLSGGGTVLGQGSNRQLMFGSDKKLPYEVSETSFPGGYSKRWGVEDLEGLARKSGKTNWGRIYLPEMGRYKLQDDKSLDWYECWGVLDGTAFYFDRLPTGVETLSLFKKATSLEITNLPSSGADEDFAIINRGITVGLDSPRFFESQASKGPDVSSLKRKIYKIFTSYKKILNTSGVEGFAKSTKNTIAPEQLERSLESFIRQ